MKNHQKIKFYGNLTTKDLKKTHSSRWEGGKMMETGREVVWYREVVEAAVVEQAGGLARN